MAWKRRTKIVCTIGPATNSVEIIQELVKNGMNVARINFSHGNYEEHRKVITAIRQAAETLGIIIPIMGDLCGPKIRIGKLEEDILLKTGEIVKLTPDSSVTANKNLLPINYENLFEDVNIGDRVLIDDGLIEVKVIDKKPTEISCEIINGGVVRSNKGVNFPDTTLSVPSLTEKDKQDIDFAIEQNIDLLALSFVRCSKDIIELKEHLAAKGSYLPIVAKIEKPQAIEDIDAIIEHSDTIMIARGDLGVEMKACEVPILQKQIIRQCLIFNKPVITATQMLESMITNPRCTRAEASDVANAVFDGTDAVMLSGETSVGKYPIQAVQTMCSILERAEQTDYLRLSLFDDSTIIDESHLAIDLSKAACRIANDINASLIITMTKSGRTAHFLSKYRPKTPIIAFTPYEMTLPLLAVTWGVDGVLRDSAGFTEQILSQARNYAIEKEYVKSGDFIVFVTGSPMLETNEINMIKIERVQ